MTADLPDSSVFQERITRAGRIMERRDLDVLLLVKPQNMLYLAGYGQLCSFLVLTRDGRGALGVPSIDVADVAKASYFQDIRGFEDEIRMLHSIHKIFEELGLTQAKVGLENTFLTVSLQNMLRHPHALPTTVTIKDATPVMAELRLTKSKVEIDLLREAAKVAEAGLEAGIRAIHPGATEIEVAGEIEHAMRRREMQDMYRTYVGSGVRSSIAHPLPTYKKIERGDLVMIDIHPVYHDYCADLCRTVSVGEPTPEQRRAHDDYVAAQRATVEAVKPGATMLGIQNVFVHSIKTNGYGSHLLGPTMHGIGLEHEEPPLPPGHAFFHGEEDPEPLLPNTTIAVGNCGLYLGNFGVRVEDVVAVTERGATELTTYRRELIVV